MRYRTLPTHCAISLLTVLALGCEPAMMEQEPVTAAASEALGGAPPVVEVRATDFSFYAPSELPSGWTTFRMANEGDEPHFLVLWLLPEDKTFDDYVEEVMNPFMDALMPFKSGEIDRGEMLERLVGSLPEWLDLVNMGRGGVGLVSPGRTGQSSVDLVPGDYVVECYMITADGEPHSMLGMLRPLTVTTATTGAREPEADIELTLTNSGIATEGALTAGRHTIRVTVAETPQGFLGHDVHLARLDEDASIEELVAWMDWVDGLNPPAPAEFLGGAEQVPSGHTSTFTVDLEPGRYVWISEGYAQDGLVKEFRVE